MKNKNKLEVEAEVEFDRKDFIAKYLRKIVYQTALRIKQANLIINVLSINTVAKLYFRKIGLRN